MKDSPYKFLDFYESKDREIFFGRESEINIFVADILINRLVVLFARTGTGKTSLINAGVRPLLESKNFRTFYVRVEQEPTEAAKNILSNKDRAASLTTQLISAVDSSIEPSTSKLKKPVVLFFDQFEEFFLQIKSPETRHKFISYVAEIYKNPESGAHLVFSMREEYFYMMDEFRSEIPSIFHKNSNLRLMPLDAEQARDAIIKPAAVRDVRFDLDLANRIVEDLQKQNDQEGIRAPSLQIICDTLWRKEDPNDKHITLQDYEDLGGGQSILDKRLAEDLEQALASTGLIPLAQNLIDKLRTDENTKYPRLFSELVETLGTDESTLHTLVDQLKDKQVIKDTTISNVPAIEWASDYLAERTDPIKKILETIELREALQQALKVDEEPKGRDSKSEQPRINEEISILQDHIPSAEWRLALDKFLELSRNPKSTENLNTNEIEFLLDTALYYQQGNAAKYWLGRLSTVNPNIRELLGKRIHAEDVNENVRKGVTVLLRELDPDIALLLLQETLDEPALRGEAIKILIDYPGDQANEALAVCLQRDDLWEDIVDVLKGSGKMRAVALLMPLLRSDTKFFPALKALEKLAQSGEAVKDRATDALISAIPILQEKLKSGSTADSAQSVLIRLAKFPDPLGSMAQKVLHESTTVPAKETELSNKKLSERIKDLFSRTKSQDRSSASGILRRRKFPVSTEQSTADYFGDLMPSIRRGTLIPIISNSFRLEQVFRSEQELANQSTGALSFDEDDLTITEQLTKEWADEMGYPMPDNHNLARVAQYYQVEQRDSQLAKAKYLKFLTNFLLDISEEEVEYKDIVGQLRNRDALFSDIVHSLDYPRFPPNIEDPLRLLASLPLSIFVTTSYHNFLERALEAANKKPRTQVCFWTGGKSSAKPEHLPDPLFEPSQSEPVVYHFFGLEDYPQTLVLSEDDFFTFLFSVAEDTNTQNPVIPLRLREGLAEARLLMLGYNLRDLDYQVLFRVIQKYRGFDFSPRGMLIQQKPRMESVSDDELLLRYLAEYFDKRQFAIEWGNPEKFIQDLWDEWNKYRMGEA